MLQIFLKIQKTLIWKKAAISTLVVVLMLMGVILYQGLRLIRAERISKKYFEKIQYLEQSLSEFQSRLENNAVSKNVPNISNIDIGLAESGWLRYENELKKVYFNYPSQYIKISELTQGDVWNLTLLSKRTKDFSGRNISLVHISNKLSPATYGDVNTPDEVVSEKYEIQGKKYDVWNYVMGEGTACGGGSIHTEVIKLKDDLFVHLETLSQQKNVNADCQGDIYNEIKTPEFELNLVRRILDTIEFEK